MVLFFGRSEMSRGNDVTMWPVRHFLLKCFTLRIVFCCAKFHKNLLTAYKRNFTISWNFYKKGINHTCTHDGLNAGKFATFWMFPKRFYHSFVLQMTLIHFRRRWTQVLLREFETHQNVSIRENVMLSSFCNF